MATSQTPRRRQAQDGEIPASGVRRRRRKRRKSRVVPALVLMTAAGSATVASYVLFWKPALVEDDQLSPITAPDVGTVGAGQGAQIRLNNRETGRKEAVIEYAEWNPIGQGRYDAVEPRAWVYLKSGEFVYLEAQSGRFHAPSEQRPQSGVLRGNVIVRVFDAAEERPEPTAPCAVEFRMASVAFDTEYGAVWRDFDPAEPTERVYATTFPRGADGQRLRTPEIEFVSWDVRVVVNQVQERIERLECRRGERLTYTPVADGVAAEAMGPGWGSATAAATTPSATLTATRGPAIASRLVPVAARTQPEAEPARTGRGPLGRRIREEGTVLYLARFEDNVRLTQGDVSASGAVLDVWARTIGGHLPEGAIGGPFDPHARPAAMRAPSGSLAEELRAMLVGVAVGAASDRWPPLRSLERMATEGAGGEGSSADAVPAAGDGEDATPAASEPPTAIAQPAPVVPSDAPGLTAGLSGDEPVTLLWDGRLDLRPLASEPEELKREHVAARLSGGSTGAVRIRDAASGADGLCAGMDFGFTTRGLVASGLGESGTRFTIPGGGSGAGARPVGGSSEAPVNLGSGGGVLRAARVEYAVPTGVGRVPGGGTLDSGALRRVRWTEQMDFVLASQGGRVLSALRDVYFRGGVVAEDDAASFRGGFAHAAFAPDAGSQTALRAITLEDGAELRGRQDERLTGQSVRVEFERRGEDDAVPTFFAADGGVVATRPGERLAAGQMEASLGAGDDGRPEVRRFEAAGDVQIASRVQGVEIAGRHVRADLEAQHLHVEGTPEAMARVTRGATTIRGEDVRLFGRPREARVLSAGTFTHETRASGSENAGFGGFASGAGAGRRGGQDRSRLDAAWTQGMTFDDASGRLRAVGDVAASLTEGGTRVDRLNAWTVEATLDPGDEPAAGAADAHGAAATGGGDSGATAGTDAATGAAGVLNAAPEGSSRRLRTLAAIGSLVDSPDGEPATIELRRYAPAASVQGAAPAGAGPSSSSSGASAPTVTASAAGADRVLVQLLYLEGARIDIDNERGLLDVPGAGKLMVVDRRTPDAERPTETSPLAGGSARGDALFEWQGSLHVDRAQGQMTMTDRVQMVHRRAGDGLTTLLDAPVLIARASGGGVGARGDEAGRLTGVHAEGGVSVRSGDKEIVADVVDYDADTGVLVAYSNTGNSVRVIEGGGVWSASAVRWDTIAGRIEITNISGGAAPR